MRRSVSRRGMVAGALAGAILSAAGATALGDSYLMDFGAPLSTGLNFQGIPASYQPIPGVKVAYSGIALYNAGPDHTVGTLGGTNYNAYEPSNTGQTYVFSAPVGIPSLWLTTYMGSAPPTGTMTLKAYSDRAGTQLLGTLQYDPPTHTAGGGNFVWGNYTGLDTFGNSIKRLEITAPGRLVQMDDMRVETSAAPRLLKIMPLGDSITNGYSNYVSYRYQLFNQLDQNNYNFDFVGSMSGISGGTPPATLYPGYNTWFDRDHEGHAGYTTAGILSMPLSSSANTNKPDVALVHLGTNDIYYGANLANNFEPAITNLGTIIDTLRAANPNVKVALAQIIPAADGLHPNVPEFNARVAALAAQKNTAQSPVLAVDQYTGFDPYGMLFDGLHPNEYGEQLMADRFFVAIQKLTDPAKPLVSPPAKVGNPSFELKTLSDGGTSSGSLSANSGQVWTFGFDTSASRRTDAGLVNPPANCYTGAASGGTPSGASGSAAAFVTNKVAINASEKPYLQQTFGSILTPHTQYTITVAVGQRLAGNQFATTYGGYDLQLLAGSSVVAESIDAITPAPGTFGDATFVVLSDDLDPAFMGQWLTLRMMMSSTGLNAATDFDNVRVTVTSVPEPAGCVLAIAAAALACQRRRRM